MARDRISDIKIAEDIAAVRKFSDGWRTNSQSICLVPTMGALHDGHLSLVREAKNIADRVIVSVFVNPIQFNNKSDYKKYPDTWAHDLAACKALGVDVIYTPSVDVMYPNGFATNVSVEPLTKVLCGAHRPGHFDGVATVVAKLFTQTRPDKAVFGEKDFQQLQIITVMARDLDLPVEVSGLPTIREESGLAMSSRNLRLLPEHLDIAPAMNREMRKVCDAVHAGKPVSKAVASAKRSLKNLGFGKIDYLEMRRERDLELIEKPNEPSRIFAAAWLGEIRLIDNIKV